MQANHTINLKNNSAAVSTYVNTIRGSERGSDRTVLLLHGERVLDVQFQIRLLDDESDKNATTLNTHETKTNGHTPLGALNASKKLTPLGIGILTNQRVLVLCVLDPSSSPLLVTNQHIHSTCGVYDGDMGNSGCNVRTNIGNTKPMSRFWMES